MPTAWKGFGAVLGEFLAPLMNGGVGNAQVAGHLRDWLPTGLHQLYRFSLKLCGIGLLDFLHDPVLLLKEYTLRFHSSTNPGQDHTWRWMEAAECGGVCNAKTSINPIAWSGRMRDLPLSE